jgi:hypothetical protein
MNARPQHEPMVSDSQTQKIKAKTQGAAQEKEAKKDENKSRPKIKS